jgi:hypothetical protein
MLKGYSVLMRFDCDLSLMVDDQGMKAHKYSYKPEIYYEHGLSKEQRQRRLSEVKGLRNQ